MSRDELLLKNAHNLRLFMQEFEARTNPANAEPDMRELGQDVALMCLMMHKCRRQYQSAIDQTEPEVGGMTQKQFRKKLYALLNEAKGLPVQRIWETLSSVKHQVEIQMDYGLIEHLREPEKSPEGQEEKA
jgi:hypothetical protein